MVSSESRMRSITARKPTTAKFSGAPEFCKIGGHRERDGTGLRERVAGVRAAVREIQGPLDVSPVPAGRAPHEPEGGAAPGRAVRAALRADQAHQGDEGRRAGRRDEGGDAAPRRRARRPPRRARGRRPAHPPEHAPPVLRAREGGRRGAPSLDPEVLLLREHARARRDGQGGLPAHAARHHPRRGRGLRPEVRGRPREAVGLSSRSHGPPAGRAGRGPGGHHPPRRPEARPRGVRAVRGPDEEKDARESPHAQAPARRRVLLPGGHGGGSRVERRVQEEVPAPLQGGGAAHPRGVAGRDREGAGPREGPPFREPAVPRGPRAVPPGQGGLREGEPQARREAPRRQAAQGVSSPAPRAPRPGRG